MPPPHHVAPTNELVAVGNSHAPILTHPLEGTNFNIWV